ncbi:phosphohexomutase domain-containing protein [Desulfogranum mediterraneum]|uniref:phosphomannomutase/phosphoglucomutase n=1 Tax=Desulfogranum mediterraneum TaxID=160661 RepID=UPI000416BE5C|nr:phosphomannomutase/phosphoglucomutase [Desulfogranum mediterraneum]
MSDSVRCFTAYDIRGKVPDDLDEELAALIGLAFIEHFAAKKIVLGHDMRLTSPAISRALTRAVLARGCDVVDIGLCGTEEVYHRVFAGADQGVDGGIMITASHNPAAYNGMKLVQREARPVSGESGLAEIEARVSDTTWRRQAGKDSGVPPGSYRLEEEKGGYIQHLLSSVDLEQLKPLKLVVNPGNGCAGPIIDLLESHLPFTFIRLQEQPDGSFPNGVPNPLLPEKRAVTAEAVREHGADLGIAWDGDFDRCFFYDETGRFIEGYYIVGLLGTAILQQHPGATILHDPRLTWNTIEMVEAAGGHPLMTRTGHAFIKENMRAADGVYGGEMSAHHYFRDFGYCDSGMVPWLLVTQLMSSSGQPLSAMVDDRMQRFPVSGEINSTVADPDGIIRQVEERYRDGELDHTDGISVSYPEYRFNIRKSNTEPVLRLNVETRGDAALLHRTTEELLALIRG